VRLVLDWDGTVTERDTLDLVLEEFGDAEVYERAEVELEAGRMTLNEVIAAEFATVTAPLEEVVAHVVEHARVRPGFAELARSWHPLVVSSGFRELIEPVLEREDVLGEVELRANSVETRPDGWRVDFRVSQMCAECGEACKRRDVEELKRVDRSCGDLPAREVVYAGDGHSDHCVSLAADRVFATDGLASWLDEQGVPYRPLTDFHALAAEL
jgi:2-hydroxy-3-keto-5-methylthiopentenyl-1-phosphate phosphatase